MVRNMASRRTEKTHSPDEELANGIVVVLLPRGTGCSSQLATKHMSARRVLNEAHALLWPSARCWSPGETRAATH